MASQKHAAALKDRGLRVVRLEMPAEAVQRLHELAQLRSLSLGALVTELLATCPVESAQPGS